MSWMVFNTTISQVHCPNRKNWLNCLKKFTSHEITFWRTISYLGDEIARTLAHWTLYLMVQQIILAPNCYTCKYMYKIALYANKFVVGKTSGNKEEWHQGPAEARFFWWKGLLSRTRKNVSTDSGVTFLQPSCNWSYQPYSLWKIFFSLFVRNLILKKIHDLFLSLKIHNSEEGKLPQKIPIKFFLTSVGFGFGFALTKLFSVTKKRNKLPEGETKPSAEARSWLAQRAKLLL